MRRALFSLPLSLSFLLSWGTTPQQSAPERAFEFSPLPPPPPDPTNAVYEDEAAARFGQALFYDERLSGDGTVSCATCHDPAKGWSDGRRLARGVANAPRHTMTLWNVAYNRWYFWDGRKDTLWSQALAPLEDRREQASSRLQVAHLIAADPVYSRAYAAVFGPLPELADTERFPPVGRPVPGEPEDPASLAWAAMDPLDREAVDEVFVDVGKAIAAFERRIVSRRAPFDVWVEGLSTGDPAKLAAISPEAVRGFELFSGKARCHLCHDGPNFTDLEFHSNRVPTSEGVDPGRAFGVRRLQKDPFNSLSKYADDGGESGRRVLPYLLSDVHGPGEFKTPTLRNVARTAPYMHEGQLDSLEQVIEFYSTLEGAVDPGSSSDRTLQPLDLTAEEKADLLAFLESLTDESLPEELLGPPGEGSDPLVR